MAYHPYHFVGEVLLHPVVWSIHYRHNVSFMCSSSERSMNYVTKMTCMLLFSTCEEHCSVGLVQSLWARGHNPSETHRDMCGVYGEDWMDHTNVSRWYTIFKDLPPWRMHTTWRRCYGPYCRPHTHMFLWNSLRLCPLALKNRTILRCPSHIDDNNMHTTFVIVHTSLIRAAHEKKKHCVCGENVKLHLIQI